MRIVIHAIIFFCPASALFSQNEIGKMRADSLRNVLTNLKTPASQLPVLKELAEIYWQQDEEVSFAKEIVDIAIRTDSFDIAYNTMAQLCRYYYNRSMRDSLFYWDAMIDTLSRRRDECPDALFTSGDLVCQEYLWSESYELAMNEAISRINLAQTKQQQYGIAIGKYDLGLIYQVIGQDSNAVVAFRQCLLWFDENRKHTQLEIQCLGDMLISTLRENLLDESYRLLVRYENLLDEMEKNYQTKGYLFPIARHRCLSGSYFSELNLRRGRVEMARSCLNRAGSFVDDSLEAYAKYVYYRACALYYKEINNSRKALAAIDSALALEENLDMLKMKMEVLRHNGKLQDAIEVYEQMLKMNTSVNNKAFDRQIDQLRILNDLNDNEKQVRALELQQAQISAKQHQLVDVLVTVVVLFFVALLLFFLYRRTGRLKDELLREKDSLIESEKQLRVVRDKAEEANRLKTAFIASISHEVRTPLNAIVGFSELLADDSFSEEDKKLFAFTIKNSSELLMNLINDVLELSRLESGNYHFTIRRLDVVVLCREILAVHEHKTGAGVRLSFSSPVESFPLNTDSFRLHQLLGHLLANAIKFTQQGEVCLSLEPDEENDVVRFIVTDTGCGIPVEKHKQIFERFEKLDEFKQGTGLGLAICRIVAARLEGSLYIDSSYTAGARFVFVHPCHLEITKEIKTYGNVE